LRSADACGDEQVSAFGWWCRLRDEPTKKRLLFQDASLALHGEVHGAVARCRGTHNGCFVWNVRKHTFFCKS
jgi:hypothetical protein